MVFASVTRFTLFVGARAALLMQCCGKNIERTWVLPHGTANLDEVLKEACWRRPHFPIKIVLDAPGIDLKREELPPTSPWTQKRILARQCSAHFPDSFVAGATALYSETGKKQALHAGVVPDVLLERVATRMEKLANPVEALSFFPAECASYAEQVAVLPKKGWSLINILTEASGLRQVVLQDGVPVFTRLHPDTVPSLPADVLAQRLLQHIASTRDYLPRLMQGDSREVPLRLFVPVLHKDIGAHEQVAALNLQVYALDAPRGEIVPPEWAADIAWLFLASRQKEAVLPLSPSWLKQRNESQWKRRIALWVLLFFGSAGVYSGVSILTKTATEHQQTPPAVAAPPAMTVSQNDMKPVAPPPSPPELTLDAVVYNSPNDWAVWINGEKHSPETASPHLQVVDVSPSLVRVLWHEGDYQHEMTLAMKNAAQGFIAP